MKTLALLLLMASMLTAGHPGLHEEAFFLQWDSSDAISGSPFASGHGIFTGLYGINTGEVLPETVDYMHFTTSVTTEPMTVLDGFDAFIIFFNEPPQPLQWFRSPDISSADGQTSIWSSTVTLGFDRQKEIQINRPDKEPLVYVFESAGANNNSFYSSFATRGDTNGDQLVNIVDLNNLALSWGSDDANWGMGDFNFDDKVDVDDLNLLALNWLRPPVIAVPEVYMTDFAWICIFVCCMWFWICRNE